MIVDYKGIRTKAPIIDRIAAGEEAVWLNPGLGSEAHRAPSQAPTQQDILVSDKTTA